MQLRDYQIDVENGVLEGWNAGHRNVLMVMPTGAGKTHTKTHISTVKGVPTCHIAHRQELVLQISESLASFGIYHNIVAPVGVVRFCAQRHTVKFGRSYYDPNAAAAVAGVQTLLRRQDDQHVKQFRARVGLWDIDEAHHVLPGNQWGRATELFPNAVGLGVTATPLRCDRKGLDGIFDHMVVGPSMRHLIDQGHLCDYRIFCPPESLDTANLRISQSSGEYVQKDLVAETERSTIVGDIVEHYLKIAPGKRGLTFTVDVKSAENVANAYNAAGVPAAVVTAKTPDSVRTNLLDQLARGDVKQLVNVDLFGEGMDCPVLDVISMGRPTQSYGLYVQQFGRPMRPADGKDHAMVIDHVGNVVRHGLPDAEREWSLAAPESRRAKKNEPQEIGVTACTECYRPYYRHLKACPHCGHQPVPSERSAPKFVDGDLIELDPTVLAQMRGEIARIDGPVEIPLDVSNTTAMAIRNNWHARQSAQHFLRETVASWAGVFKYGHGESDSEIQRRFYLRFGIDMASMMVLNAKDAENLTIKVRKDLE